MLDYNEDKKISLLKTLEMWVFRKGKQVYKEKYSLISILHFITYAAHGFA